MKLSETGLVAISRPLAPLMLLCVECESHTEAMAPRQITPEGRCATCGSASVLPAPKIVWAWLQGFAHGVAS